MKFFFLVIILISSVAFADLSKVFSSKAQAVVKILIKLQGVEVSFGSGFFINQDGYFLTNYHVVKTVFTPGYTMSVVTKDRNSSSDVQFVTCEIYGLDVCLLKVNLKPKQWVNISDISAKMEGSIVATIGHPRGLDWTISDGLISGLRKQKTTLNYEYNVIQLSAPLSPGSSGGPIFDQEGKFAGIVTSGIFSEKAQSLNFGVSAKSVNDFHTKFKNTPPIKLSDFKKEFSDGKRAVTKKIVETAVNDEVKLINNGQKPTPRSKVASFKSQTGREYRFFYPALNGMVNCSSKKEVLVCQIAGGDFIIVEEVAGVKDFKSVDSKVMPPVPLLVTQDLIKSKAIDVKKMNPRELKYLHSVSQPIKCVDLKARVMKQYVRCSALTYNYEYPDNSSFLKQIETEKGKPFLQIRAIASNADTSLLVFSISDMLESSFTNLTNTQIND